MSEEFFTPTGDGKADADLHAPLLDTASGEAAADMEAVARAVERGMTLPAATALFAGPAARLLLERAAQ